MAESPHLKENSPKGQVTQLTCELGTARRDIFPGDLLDLFLNQIPRQAAHRKSEAPVGLCHVRALMVWGVLFFYVRRPGAGR